ncbi:MAG: muconate cycloisomerase, partial [Propionibacteriales bacterium]|nr:muconate cycloisomerase [Propionibacteriales bacterium]
MSRVISVEAFPVEVPVIKTFAFASGTAGAAGSVVIVPFVKVTDSDGHVGWGEGRPSPSWNYETADSILSTIRDYLAPALLGLQPSDRWGLHQRMRSVIGLGPSTGMPVAKAALDIALHDLGARAAGLTLRAFLGGSDDRCEVELSYT